VYFLTRFSGMLFLICAVLAIVLSIMDTAPEFNSARVELGDEPIGSSVRFKIGSEIVFDVFVVAGLALFGWFLWSSEIQQTWAIVITFLLLTGSIVIRVTPVLPMSVARHSPGMAFWGALVIDDYYPSPLKVTNQARKITAYPANEYYLLAVTEPKLSGNEAHPGEAVALDFNKAQPAHAQFWAAGWQGAQITGTLAGTRTILDYDFERVVYSVPHLMVQKVEQVGARNQGQ